LRKTKTHPTKPSATLASTSSEYLDDVAGGGALPPPSLGRTPRDPPSAAGTEGYHPPCHNSLVRRHVRFPCHRVHDSTTSARHPHNAHTGGSPLPPTMPRFCLVVPRGGGKGGVEGRGLGNARSRVSPCCLMRDE
jgi:hypothetical protein